MTDKEIKLELAKVALTKCSFTTSETLTESLKNVYEWITEHSEEEEPKTKNAYDDIDIQEVVKRIKSNTKTSSGIATTLESIFHSNGIQTVGDLLRMSKREFSKYRCVGKKSISAIEDALDELGVTW